MVSIPVLSSSPPHRHPLNSKNSYLSRSERWHGHGQVAKDTRSYPTLGLSLSLAPLLRIDLERVGARGRDPDPVGLVHGGDLDVDRGLVHEHECLLMDLELRHGIRRRDEWLGRLDGCGGCGRWDLDGRRV